MRTPFRLAASVAASVLALAASGCDHAPPEVAPVNLSVRALTGTSCGDPDAPNPGVSPLADISSLTVEVLGFDPLTGEAEELARKTTDLAGQTSVVVSKVPEGDGHQVTVFATGASSSWFGRDTSVAVKRNQDNPIDLVLARYGGYSCVSAPATIPNVVFPAAVELGDGRVLVTGGFTAVQSDGGGTRLGAPSAQGFIFDGRTGELYSVGSMGANAGRGAHAMVLLPQAGKVLIVGGMNELDIDETRAFPFVFDKADGRSDYILYDIATGTFTPGTETMELKRGFPRAHALADGTAVITGGGPWPFDTADAGYLQVEIFDPERNEGAGGFLPVQNFRSFYTRAGHSLTFLRSSDEGLTQLLVWGGTTLDRSLGHPAEVFRQSGRQRELVNGTFAEVVIVGDTPTFTYFHETTPLSNQRFLVTGGAAFRDGAIGSPQADEAYVLTYVPDPVPTIQVQKVPGLGVGRVFHSAVTHDASHVTVMGGFSGLDAITTDKVKFFDLGNPPQPWTMDAAANDLFAPRGGHAGILMRSGATLLAGGESNARPQGAVKRASVEVFTPSTIATP